MASSQRLHDVAPREQAGAQTDKRFEFQYHQAAHDCLETLDEGSVTYVYCEWHDDYVIETPTESYSFCQVKTRTSRSGLWSVNEFFGLHNSKGPATKGTKRSKIASSDSIFARLYDHTLKFHSRCERFYFVSDTELAFEDLLERVRSAAQIAKLNSSDSACIKDIHASLATPFPQLQATDLFTFLQKLHFRKAIGSLDDLEACRTLIGGRILDLSEVDLRISEARRIGTELVAAVRERSHRTFTAPPPLQELRKKKALSIEDVLRLLSLSVEGYRQLRATGRDSVVALSRLHRLLRRSDIDESIVPTMCRLKADWGAWWISHRHADSTIDFTNLKLECVSALRYHSDGRLSWERLSTEAKALAMKYATCFSTSNPLTAELIFGLLLSLAVEAEK